MRSMPPLALHELAEQPFRLTVSAKLDADPLAVFTELGDPSPWFPLMRRSVWKTGATSGVGAEREVDVAAFGRFRERMLAWDHGERVAFTMISSTSPLVAQIGEDWVVRRDGSETRLEWHVAARPTLVGRVATPALRAILSALFKRGCANIQKRVGTYRGAHAKHVS